MLLCNDESVRDEFPKGLVKDVSVVLSLEASGMVGCMEEHWLSSGLLPFLLLVNSCYSSVCIRKDLLKIIPLSASVH